MEKWLQVTSRKITRVVWKWDTI